MLSLKLTEFPDAEGKCVYFRLPDLSVAVPDELALGEKQAARGGAGVMARPTLGQPAHRRLAAGPR